MWRQKRQSPQNSKFFLPVNDIAKSKAYAYNMLIKQERKPILAHIFKETITECKDMSRDADMCTVFEETWREGKAAGIYY